MFVYLFVWETRDTTGDQQETKGCAGGMLNFEQTKGMFVYDLVADFSATKPCGIVRTKQATFSNLLFGIATFGDTHRQPTGHHRHNYLCLDTSHSPQERRRGGIKCF